MTVEGGGSLPSPRVLHEELLTLRNELDALGGEDEAALEKYRRAENLVSQAFVHDAESLSILLASLSMLNDHIPLFKQLETSEKEKAELEKNERSNKKSTASIRVSFAVLTLSLSLPE